MGERTIMPGLLETLQGAVTPDLVEHLAGLLGESPDATAKGLTAVLPTLLGALTMRTEHEGIADVMHATHVGLGGGNPLDGLVAGLSSPDVRSTLMDHGATIATQLLGAQSAPVTAALAGQSGLKGDTIGSLIKLGGPMAMGALAKALGGEPTAQGTTDLLHAERPAIMAALPPGIRELLAPLAAAATPLHGTPVEAAAESALSASRWLPWLIGLMVAIILFAGLRGCQDQDAEKAALSSVTTPIVTEAPREEMEIVLPDGTALKLESGHVGFELVRFLQSAEPAPRSFRFEDLTYDSADSSLDAQSAATVRTVAAIMQAFPTMTARIVGHTDNQGEASANQTLSETRARAVETLVEESGIADARIASEGRGQTEPIATNDTAEGRAQNRRTVILVLTK